VLDTFVLGLDWISRTPNFFLRLAETSGVKTNNYQLPFRKRIKPLHQAKYIHSFLETLIPADFISIRAIFAQWITY
jgi:hypothetical protein